MESIFAVPWSDLEPEHVEEFLANASGEGLIWEGKGTDPLSQLKSKIVAGVCGLANQLGGFFVIGAEQDADAWTLPGVPNNVAEDAHDWLARILTGNLREPPPFEVRRWNVDVGRVAAVINVEQATVPPCMTKDGLVWMRLVGETKRVKEPQVLAELLRKGQAARDAAEERALRIVTQLLHAPTPLPDDSLRFALALAPTTARADYASRLFTAEFREGLHSAVAVLERSFADERATDETAMGRDGYLVRRGRFREGSWQWVIQALWDGSVAVEFVAPAPAPARHPPTVDTIIAQAWRAAAAPLPTLTGIPDREHVLTHLAIHMTDGFRLYVEGVPGPLEVTTGHHRPIEEWTTRDRPIQRWTNMAEPTEDELESVKRELVRSAGLEAFEPQ